MPPAFLPPRAPPSSRPIRAERLDPSALGPEAAAMRPMLDHYDRHGLLGNALTLRAYFEELAHSSG